MELSAATAPLRVATAQLSPALVGQPRRGRPPVQQDGLVYAARATHAAVALRERAQLREQHTPPKSCMSVPSCARPTASGAAARIT